VGVAVGSGVEVSVGGGVAVGGGSWVGVAVFGWVVSVDVAWLTADWAAETWVAGSESDSGLFPQAASQLVNKRVKQK